MIESVADLQKYRFKVENPDQFCRTGLFQWCRHPNYLGELICWWALTMVMAQSYSGWGHVAWISPVWITIMLLKISGIPILEEDWVKKYGHREEFQNYIEGTPRLIPIRWKNSDRLK